MGFYNKRNKWTIHFIYIILAYDLKWLKQGFPYNPEGPDKLLFYVGAINAIKSEIEKWGELPLWKLSRKRTIIQ